MSWGGGETAVLPAGGNEWGAGGGGATNYEWDDGPKQNGAADGGGEWNDGPKQNGFANGDDDNFGGGGFGDGGEGGGRVNDGKCFNGGEEGYNRSDCTKPQVMQCRYCKKEGHMIAECPEAPKGCMRCGSEEHRVKDCPEPLVCKNCNEEGHYAKECPTRICNNCGKTGHSINDCKDARAVDRSMFPDKSVEEAWAMIRKSAADRDSDDVKEAVQIYIKASPETTYPELEQAFRKQGVGLHLIALEKTSLAMTLTNMDLQGNMDKKYTVNYRFSDKPARPREAEGWPSPEENIERLADAGDVVDRGLSKCSNCNELGHISRSCPQEKNVPADRAVIKCFNCDSEGHRVRDCPIARVNRFACKNCNKEGHHAKECPEPRNPATVMCKKCEEMGHFAKDCPKDMRPCYNCGEVGHMSSDCTAPPKCRNCDVVGHTGKECPKPRDWSRVQCSNCKQMGHTKVRCKQPVPNEDGDDGGLDHGGGGFDNDGGNNGGFDNAAGGGDDWNAGASGGGGGGGGDW